MGMLKDFFAGIVLFFSSVLGISDPQAYVLDAPPADPPAAKVTVDEGTSATTTVITYVTQPVIERTVQAAVSSDAPTRAELRAAIAGLRSEFASLAVSGVSAPFFGLQVDRIYDSVGRGLSNTQTSFAQRIANLSVADIPDLSAVYLPLTGGSLTGSLSGTDLTLSGTLTANALSVAAVASAGAVEAPYFVATSTLATTTLSGGLSVLGYLDLATTTITGGLTVNGNTNITEGGQLTVGDKIIAPGEIGLGTSTPFAKLSVQSTNAAQTTFAVVGASGQTAPLLDILHNPTSNTNVVRVTAAGNVGIGTGSPATKLDVVGNVRVNGTGGSARLQVANSSGTSVLDIWQFDDHGIIQATNQLRLAGTSFRFENPLNTTVAAIGSDGGRTFVVGSSWSGDATFRALSNMASLPVAILQGTSGQTADLLQWKSNAGNVLGVINASGNVGIGTTTPWGKLSVTGSGTGTGKAFVVANSANTPRMVVEDNGNVGIGTMAPVAKFDVRGADASNPVESAIFNDLPGTGFGPGAALRFHAPVGNLSPTPPVARILGTYAGNCFGNNCSVLKFQTAANASSFADAMFISGRRVSIGTPSTNPEVPLEVAGPSAGASVETTGILQLSRPTGVSWDNIAEFAVGRYQVGDTNPYSRLDIKLKSTGHSAKVADVTVMTLQASGNVGIATTSPWRRLSVTGTVGFDGLGSTGGTQTLCLTANKEVVTNNGECVSSSEELKQDIRTISLSATDMVSAMRPVSFKYLGADRPTYGFIAEDVAAIDNRFIGYFDQSGSPRTINTASILAVAVKAVQELANRIASLFNTTERHEAELQQLRSRVSELEARAQIATPPPTPPPPSADTVVAEDEEDTDLADAEVATLSDHATSTNSDDDSPALVE